VPGIPDAAGLTSFVPADGGRELVHAVAFVRGARLFIVAAQHADTKAMNAVVLELAKAEAALVP
jgi:hypothetical protein